MKNIRRCLTLIVTALLPILLAHCGVARFKIAGAPYGSSASALGNLDNSVPQDPGNPGGIDPLGSPVDPAVIAQLCASQTVEAQDFDVFFPENSIETCEWDNTSEAEQHFGAMRAETKSFTLPVGAILCGVQMDAKGTGQQLFEYNDYFVFSLNEYVIAANEAVPLTLGGTQWDPMIFDWALLKDKSWYTPDIDTDPERSARDRSIWCPHGGTSSVRCVFPDTQTVGPVHLELPDSVFQYISAKAPRRTTHDLTLTLIGDNDKVTNAGEPIDCTHRAIDLSLRASFVRVP
jgi:hypothetical protein